MTNVFQEEKFNPITELEIGDVKYKAKGSLAFDRKAKDFATKNEEGKKEGTGIQAIYNGLLNRNSESIIQFWICALAHKKELKEKDIEEAVEKIIDEKDDTIELLQGAVTVLNDSGFFKQQIKMFWFQMSQAHKLVKDDEKEEAKKAHEYMKETYVILTGKQPY